MSDSLKLRTLHALFWSFLERFGQQGLQFVISIILARLLLPKEFGLIAMLTLFMAIAQSFINSGFGQALIQKQNVTHVDKCSIFYFNIFVGFLAAGLLCLAAPWIADFYKQPLLVPLTYALSLNLIINAFGLVQTTLLTKHIDFKTQLKVSVIATGISGTIGVALAFNGFGVWSLVAQSLGSNLLRTILLWFFSTWRPSLVFSFASLRGMYAFGSRLLVAGLSDTIFLNIYSVVIGKLFPPAALGFYTRAKSFQQLPTASFSSAISRVTFPVFSIIRKDPERLKQGMKKALTMMVFVNFPLMIGLAVTARPLILVLLSEKWAPCIPYLQLLCIGGMLWPLHVINLNVLIAKGRSDLILWLEVLKKSLVVISIIITYRWGITAMIYGQIVVSFLCYYLNCYYVKKLVRYSIAEQVHDFLPYLAASAVMGIGVYCLEWFVFSSELILLVSQVFVGMVTYAFLCYCLRLGAFTEVYDMLLLKGKTIFWRAED